jgi:hypothetical protein
VLDSSRVRLEWTDAANETGFGLYDGTMLMVTVPANTTTYTVTGLAPSSQHCFRITAYNLAGESGATATDCVTTLPSESAPAPSPTPPSPSPTPPADSRRFFVSATLNLNELRPCIPAGGLQACDATRRALWNGEAGAWSARGVTDPDARFNETVVFRVQAGDPVAIANIARILGWPFLQITGLHFGEGQEYVEIANLGGGPQALDGWTLRSPDRGMSATFGPGMTLGPGTSCRVYSGGGGSDVCGTTLFDARDVWPDDGGMVVLMADPIGLLADESRYSADVNGQPPPPNLEGATIAVTGAAR